MKSLYRLLHHCVSRRINRDMINSFNWASRNIITLLGSLETNLNCDGRKLKWVKPTMMGLFLAHNQLKKAGPKGPTRGELDRLRIETRSAKNNLQKSTRLQYPGHQTLTKS